MFADDGLLLANSVGEITTLIRKTIEIAEEMGLKINREKSNCMVFNTTETRRQIGGIGIVSDVKYLGVRINNTKNCYRLNKIEKLKKCHKYANLTYSVVYKSCNRVLIGKNLLEKCCTALNTLIFICD